MEIQRLVVEEAQNSLTLDFHAGLTVAFHENPAVRTRFLSDVVQSLGPGRAGLHLEFVDHRQRHLTVFRPRGGHHRVVDIEHASDETARFQVAGGSVDVLGQIGLDVDAASKLLRVGARHIDRGPTTGTDNHRNARRLAALEQSSLWYTALHLRQADAILDQARRDLPERDVEQAVEFGQLEARHQQTEAILAFHRPIQRLGVGLTAACLGVGLALLVADRHVGDNGFTGRVLVALGVVAAAVTATDRIQTRRLRAEERAVLRPLGAGSFEELVRQAGPLAQAWRRRALIDATASHRSAGAAWEELTGGVSLAWALEHRPAIEAIASQKGRLRRVGAEHLATDESGVADSARVLVDKIIELQEVGVTREQLPLLLDEPFSGHAPLEVERMLSTIHRMSAHHQILLVTGDPYIQAWATGSAAASTIAFARLGRTRSDAASNGSVERATEHHRLESTVPAVSVTPRTS